MTQHLQSLFAIDKCEGWEEFFHAQYENILPLLVGLIADVELFDKTVYPQYESIFKAWSFCKPEDIKVVILGQDPYPGGQATGLAFAVRQDTSPLPPSLANIFKEIEDEGLGYPEDNTLSAWALQGVLLLNSSLTVEKGSPRSHAGTWEHFVWQSLKFLLQKNPDVRCMAWGKSAQTMTLGLPFKEVVRTTHPSPLSASRGFLGSGIFKRFPEIKWA